MLYVDIVKRLSSFDLRVKFEADGAPLGIFGASGSGKSMTLKCIAGIERPDSGKIILNGRTLFDSSRRINLRPQERSVGYLFQDYALFPDMTVKGNIIAGLHRLKKAERPARADELMESFKLTELSDKKPDRLSGGERQRVALARLMAGEPELMLLDEPFSSLDTVLKLKLIRELNTTLESFGKGCLMVSHDVGELCAVCGRVTTIIEGANSPVISSEDFERDIRELYNNREKDD